MEQKIYVEDAIEFHNNSKTYRKVIEHRAICKKWGRDFCLDCFGGGLTKFARDLELEKSLSTKKSSNNDFKAHKSSPKDFSECPKCHRKYNTGDIVGEFAGITICVDCKIPLKNPS